MEIRRPSYETLKLSFKEGGTWVVQEPWCFATGRWDICVPAGFATDLASVPRVLWWFLPPFGAYIGAAVMHDNLYATGAVTRAEADRAFLAAMIVDGERTWRAHAMYAAVRVWGGIAWRRHRKRSP